MPEFDISDPTIRIIHVSDLHMNLNPADKFNISTFIDKLVDDINKYKGHLLLFTGDISNSGKEEEFNEVENLFFNRIKTDNHIFEDRIVLCPGNHDIDWERLKLVDDNLLDNMVVEGDSSDFFLNSAKVSVINNTRNAYLAFAKKYNNTESTVYSDEFLTIKSIHFGKGKENKKINIVSMSSNIRCRVTHNTNSSNIDHGELILGEFQIRTLTKHLPMSDLNILITHHPISYLTDREQSLLINNIKDLFQLHFFGHIHDRSLWQTIYENNNLISLQTSALYASNVNANSCYTQISWKLKTNSLEFKFQTYNKNKSKWITSESSKEILLDNQRKTSKLKELSYDITKFNLIIPESFQESLMRLNISKDDFIVLLQSTFIGHINFFVKDYEKLPISIDFKYYVVITKKSNDIEFHRIVNCENVNEKIEEWDGVILNYRKLIYFDFRRTGFNKKLTTSNVRDIIKEHYVLGKSIEEYFRLFENLDINTSCLGIATFVKRQIQQSYNELDLAEYLSLNRRQMDQYRIDGQIISSLEASLTALHKIILNYYPGNEYK